MSKIALCPASAVAPDDTKAVDANGRALVVYNLDGEFFASDDCCTHAEAALSDGWIEDGEIVCPFHDGRFDIRTGEATGAPCIVPLKTYPVSEEDGTLYAEVDDA